MKKIVLLLLLSLTSIGVSSQLKLGVKAGINNTFPSYKIDSDVLVKPKTSGLGSVLGVFFEVPITETFIFQTELLIDFRYYNAHTTIEESSTNFSSKTEDFGYNKLAYFDFPLFFKYNIRLKTASNYGSDNYFGIYAGPLLGFKILENYEGNRTTTITSFEQKTVSTNEIKDYSVDFKPFDLSISVGAMLDYEKGLRIGLRYIRSLAAANKNSEFEINYNVLQLSVGYNFIED
jgi:hypothetical protein